MLSTLKIRIYAHRCRPTISYPYSKTKNDDEVGKNDSDIDSLNIPHSSCVESHGEMCMLIIHLCVTIAFCQRVS